MSRRAADDAVYRNRVLVNGRPPSPGQQVTTEDTITLDDRPITCPVKSITIMLHKPAGYVTSREGQGNRTIYDFLPPELHILKPVGRLDKDSSGLILLTTDGDLAQRLTHPKYEKQKTYLVRLDKPLEPLHHQMINDHGVRLEDGPSRLQLSRVKDGDDTAWQVTMHEGRNRQIRRTFAALGYEVIKLHRSEFGSYQLGNLAPGGFVTLDES
jgi:23S rRNA pseudouridine2605 synthase